MPFYKKILILLIPLLFSAAPGFAAGTLGDIRASGVLLWRMDAEGGAPFMGYLSIPHRSGPKHFSTGSPITKTQNFQ